MMQDVTSVNALLFLSSQTPLSSPWHLDPEVDFSVIFCVVLSWLCWFLAGVREGHAACRVEGRAKKET